MRPDLKFLIVSSSALGLVAFDASAGDTDLERVLALPECPLALELNQSSGCLSLDLFSGIPADDPQFRTRLTHQRLPEAVLAPSPYWATRFAIRGRLNDGPETEYAVTLYNYDFPCDTDGAVALLGYSESGLPLIQTDLGPFELANPEFQVGATSYYVINPDSREITARLIGSTFRRLNFVFHRADEISVFDPETRECLTAPSRESGLLQRARNCRSLALRSSPGENVGLSEAHPGDLDIARHALGENWWAANQAWASELVSRTGDGAAIIVNNVEICT
ncbi:hypothetical protein [Maricaulis parjimensis]|uniref:hypothetical protein n=1 Tax=Maricaulis parjimensis TaxID=144023 RepID=UPI0019399E1B|nr:hypothetical protein [Maricaulis parjimensis]